MPDKLPKADIQPTVAYLVKLLRPIKVGPSWVRPCDSSIKLLGTKAIEYYDDLSEIHTID